MRAQLKDMQFIDKHRVKKAWRGFSLIELLLVVVVLGLVGTSLVKMFGQLSQGLSLNNNAQIAAQLAQECREYLLTTRRVSGYAMPGVADCSALVSFQGQGVVSVAKTEPYIGSSCPTGSVMADCKLFTITASYQSGTAQQTLMVVDY